MTFNCELFPSEFSVLSGRLIKNTFPLHICRPKDYTTEISVLLQIQFYSIFTTVPSIIFKSWGKLVMLPILFMLIRQKSLSLPRNLALATFGELLIVFSTKVKLLYLPYLTDLRYCLLLLIKKNICKNLF